MSTLRIDTIYFCATADSLYPIELGYDVNGRNLAPNYGKWTLYTTSGTSAVASDFDFAPVGNGGSGNAFKVVASTIGGYIFQYEATDVQCGLLVGEKYWAIVFILPDAAAGPVQKDTILCPDPTPLTWTISQSFPYSDLYAKAGFTVTWKPASGQYSINRDQVGIDTVYRSVGKLTNLPAGYSCPDSVVYKLHVEVKDLSNLTRKAVAVCAVDTAGANQNRPINDFFNRPNTVVGPTILDGQGYYSPADLAHTSNPWTQVGTTNVYWAAYTYTYKDCQGNQKTVVDSLYLTESPANHYWGDDTATYCRSGAPVTLNLYNLYNSAAGSLKPQLITTNSYWYEKGQVVSGSYPSYTYSPPVPGSLVGAYEVNTDPAILSANIGYHYKWLIDQGANCFAGDSGRLVLILQDPFAGKDYAGQVCSAATTTVDLEAYTGITGATWNAIVGGTPTSVANAKTVTLGTGTNIFTYTTAGGCGVATTSKVYLKNTANVKIPSSTKVKFCISKLPAAINLNEVLGLIDGGISWSAGTATGVTVNAAGYNATTGVIEIGTYSPSLGANTSGTVTFTASNLTCGINSATVTIEFVTSL
ncbi:MAG: hypothetical protein LBD59_05565 [Prevotellaceae bacterium]|nr:hypothetical protein [Prevotellaceae bacterium]